MKIDTIIFDFAGTLVKMRPATLLIDRVYLNNLSKKYKLAIITGGARAEVLNILRKLKINQYFQVENIITKDDTILRKPNPILLKMVIKKIRATKSLYIGDNSKDFKMANMARIPFIYSQKLLSSRRKL